MKAKIWIARDKDGALYLYSIRPVKTDYYFEDVYNGGIQIDSKCHEEITWENSPQKIEI